MHTTQLSLSFAPAPTTPAAPEPDRFTTWLTALVDEVTRKRRDGYTHAQGSWDVDVWSPSKLEDPDGSIAATAHCTRLGARYACETREHCARLVGHALAGNRVPSDVRNAVARALTAWVGGPATGRGAGLMLQLGSQRGTACECIARLERGLVTLDQWKEEGLIPFLPEAS